MLKSKIHCLENSHIKIKNFIMLNTYLLLYRLQNTDSHSSYDNQLAISLLDKQKWTDLPTRSWKFGNPLTFPESCSGFVRRLRGHDAVPWERLKELQSSIPLDTRKTISEIGFFPWKMVQKFAGIEIRGFT